MNHLFFALVYWSLFFSNTGEPICTILPVPFLTIPHAPLRPQNSHNKNSIPGSRQTYEHYRPHRPLTPNSRPPTT